MKDFETQISVLISFSADYYVLYSGIVIVLTEIVQYGYDVFESKSVFIHFDHRTALWSEMFQLKT